MNIVQVGANKGYDDLTEIIKDQTVDYFVAVEPFHEHNLSLKTCYKDIKNFQIENLIIADVNVPEIKGIFYHQEDSNHSNSFELASLNRQHSLNIRDNYTEDGVVERHLNCISLNTLFKRHNLTHIDLLYVDTEGYDDRIIKHIDFDTFSIDIIYYENLHIDVNSLREFLTDKGYNIENNVTYGGWSDRAVKIKS